MKKRLLVIAMVLALVTTGALVTLANDQGTGVIVFEDTRLGDSDIIVDPGPGGGGDCGDCGEDDCPICNLPDEWRALLNRGAGLDFWTHDLADVANAPATVLFNSVRENNAAWDPLAGSGEESFTGLYVASNDDDNVVVWVSMTGFFNNNVHVLPNHALTLNVADSLGASAGQFGSVTIQAQPGGQTGAGQALNSGLASAESVALLYEGVLSAPRGVALDAELGEATAQILWSIVIS